MHSLLQGSVQLPLADTYYQHRIPSDLKSPKEFYSQCVEFLQNHNHFSHVLLSKNPQLASITLLSLASIMADQDQLYQKKQIILASYQALYDLFSLLLLVILYVHQELL